ncbi:MAG: U32 family peptidase [Bacteroidales bacterium]|jgi:putative protease|nr:U32 family peptidase [Bacteroidales bacterium]
MQIKLELLAPAKNKEIGIAAINCGADSVYMGGPNFGAREAAGNSIYDISETVKYAHDFDAGVYITINTILYDCELNRARKVIEDVYEAGCDAIIIQDMAILGMELPPVRIFASTQMNIRNAAQAEFLSRLGFERLILARELSLEQISEIRKHVSADLETFIEGALCVSYSGQCYLSEKVAGRSANRGCCAQPCRSDYTLADSENRVMVKDRPLLSLKDLDLGKQLPDLIKAGVSSFKIEGRLKNISYIKNNVRYYDLLLNDFISKNNGYVRSSSGIAEGGFRPNINKTFNRGFTSLFINGCRGKWNSGTGAGGRGEETGRITGSSCREGKTFFKYTPYTKDNTINNGDGLYFITPGGEISGARASVCIKDTVEIDTELNLPQGSIVFRNLNTSFEKELVSHMPERIIKIPVKIIASEGHFTITTKTSYLKEQVSAMSEKSYGPARNPEKAMKTLYGQLQKRSGIYKPEIEEASLDEIPFFPISEINSLRRTLCSRISESHDKTYLRTDRKEVRPIDKIKIPNGKTTGGTAPEELDYRGNISNSKAASIYEKLGTGKTEKAYELEHRKVAELMRTKYCLKYELGLCPNYKRTAVHDPSYHSRLDSVKFKEPLYLLNGGNKLELRFDCRKCEMIIIN